MSAPPESFAYCNDGNDYHSVVNHYPLCPNPGCRAWGDEILEQGYPHNHRHHCYRCGVTYWIRQA